MSNDLIEITTSREFRRFKSKELKVIESKKFDDGYEFKASDGEYYFLPMEYESWVLENTQIIDQYSNNLIYGKDKTRNVVSVEIKSDKAYIYTETPEGVKLETRPFKRWILSNIAPAGEFSKLDGGLHFQYLKEFDDEKSKKDALNQLYRIKGDKYTCYDERESFMQMSGVTYFKGMDVKDVSILSFDIETNKTLDPKLPHAKTLLIANTFRKNGMVTKKLFALDDFKNELSMILSWCEWVREMNPSVITGHNIFAFDLYYLQNRLVITQKTQIFNKKTEYKGLPLGRNGEPMEIATKVSQFRKDGSQSYDYRKVNIFGREIIDGFFMSIRYDMGREFPSYGLKPIIEHLGLEKEGRIKWDFEANDPNTIWENRHLSEYADLWSKYKEYCNDDADDSLTLYDLMVGPYFHATTNFPLTFQAMYETASGKQINALLIRGYLQKEHSIPEPSEAAKYQGAISFGVPGVYKNVFKIDVASLYPSIMRQFKVYDNKKDPLGLFLEMIETFTVQRLKHKKIAKDTGDNFYKNLEQSEKLVINSGYGFMGASGLHFNSPKNAAFVTEKGREILTKAVEWATGKDVEYWLNKLGKNDEGEEDEEP